jgi:hypothetical protein
MLIYLPNEQKRFVFIGIQKPYEGGPAGDGVCQFQDQPGGLTGDPL